MICPHCGKETDTITSAAQPNGAGAAQSLIVCLPANINACNPIGFYRSPWHTGNVPANVCSGAYSPQSYFVMF